MWYYVVLTLQCTVPTIRPSLVLAARPASTMRYAMLKELLSRNDCRELGLDVSNTTFQRWESPEYGCLLTPIKPAGKQSGRVYYHRDEVERLKQSRPTNPKTN